MISLKLADTFGDDAIFVSEFLRAGRRWAPTFCDNWENQLEAAEKSVDFFKITRAYRLVVIRENQSSSRSTANAATLQGITQEQSAKGESFNQDGQRSINKGKSKEHNHSTNQKGDGKCICGEEHPFKKCPYIVKSNRKRGWKEDKNVRDEMREQIKKRLMVHRAIKHMTDTNILDGLGDPYSKKEGGEDISSSPAELEASSSFRFGNMTTSSHMNEIHFLFKSVIYDSGCSDSLTFDRDRFVGEIRSADEWIKTSNGLMNVAGYGTMIVKGKLGNKIVKLEFANTAWISSTDVTLISSTRLIKEGYDRDPHTNTLMHMKTGTKVCEISMHCNVLLLEFNPIKHANSVQLRKSTTAKTTPWFWHLRLGHCRPEVINQLKKIEGIEVVKGDGP